jgi:glutamate synthase (NADPH/NADH) small chain
MAKPTGFLEFGRKLPPRRAVPVRLRDWREVYEPFPEADARDQGARCMDCGIPFCHEGCPLGNLIPEWNDLVYNGDWRDAVERLHATNNFPEFTGRLCPAPCEAACVLGINSDPVTIERIEYEIAERGWSEGWVTPVIAEVKTGKSVAVVGSGPAGLAVAQQLVRAGHKVTVFERAEMPGGLLRFGIPEFKMEKAVLERRLSQLAAEGVEFRCGVSVGMPPDDVQATPATPTAPATPATPATPTAPAAPATPATPATSGGSLNLDRKPEPGEERGLGTACAEPVQVLSARELVDSNDAVVLACGATLPRELEVTGRQLRGVHLALEYLKPSNLVREGRLEEAPISAAGKRVVIIGGGDTGADCLGTAHRQGATEVRQLEILPQPPDVRADNNPWPTWPLIIRTSSAHEEGGDRIYAVETTELVDDGTGAVAGLRAHQVRQVVEDGRIRFEQVESETVEIACELVLIAMGFVGAERMGVVSELGLQLDARGNVACDSRWATNREGVFVCGDVTRGQSLIVWAIAEGRSCAAAVDRWLMGDTALPSPLEPGQLAIR